MGERLHLEKSCTVKEGNIKRKVALGERLHLEKSCTVRKVTLKESYWVKMLDRLHAEYNILDEHMLWRGKFVLFNIFNYMYIHIV